MKRGRQGETRTRQTRKEDRNGRKTVLNKERMKRLRGSFAEGAHKKFCEWSQNPNNSLARNPRKRAEV